MKCHYEVLGLSLQATDDEIKKAYRKSALQWHPDKHVDSNNKEEANKRFLEIQDAYETLIDPQERAWYDSHREVLINGGTPGDPSEAEYAFNIFPFFSPTCFKGYSDDEKGFYTVYREMFAKIAEEDRPYYEEEVKIPDFGTSTSDYDSVVGPFYSFWMSYCTPRSFVWTEKYDTRDAEHRQVRRAMEKENKKFKEKAKKERNEEIRKLVSLVRKRDKRLDEYKKQLEEKQLLAQKKSQEKKEADRLRRIEQMKSYVEPEWSAVDKKLEELDLAENPKPKVRQVINSDNEEDENINEATVNDEDDDFDESLFCVACNKAFKNEKSFMNHEKSKKHRENIDLLKKHMREEDKDILFGQEDNDIEVEETKQPEGSRNKLSKKQKKKRKQNRNNLNSSSSGDEDETQKENIEVEADLNKQVDEIKQDDLVKEEDIMIEAELPVPKPAAICSVCNKEFESRSKLFTHIKEEGHAALKTEQAALKTDQPLSHNTVKKNKRLAKAKK